MKTKGKAHEALSLMFQHEGVPPLMVLDGLKEQTLGKFRQKLQDAGCEMENTEPYSPYSLQNAAKREIKELEKGAGKRRKLLLTNTPQQLWGKYLEYEAYVRSHVACDIFKLDREIPKTIMSGEIAVISHFCKLGWNEWLSFALPLSPSSKAP